MIKETKTYMEEITAVISILHDLKHSGKLPKELGEWRSWIECFNPNKILLMVDNKKQKKLKNNKINQLK